MKKVLRLIASGGTASLRSGFYFTPIDLVFMPCCIASHLLYEIYDRNEDWHQSPVLHYLDKLALQRMRPTQFDISETIGDLGARLPKFKAKLYKDADETRTLTISQRDTAFERPGSDLVPPILGATLIACLQELSQLDPAEIASSESVAEMPELLWESLEIMTIRSREDRHLPGQQDGRIRLPQESIKAALDRKVERVVRAEDRVFLQTRSHSREPLRLDIVFHCSGEESPRRGLSANISSGGVFVESPRPAEVRETIELEICSKDRDYSVTAMVMTCDKNGMGLRFMGGKDLEALRQALTDHTLAVLDRNNV